MCCYRCEIRIALIYINKCNIILLTGNSLRSLFTCLSLYRHYLQMKINIKQESDRKWWCLFGFLLIKY